MLTIDQKTPAWIKERRRGVRISLGTHASILGGSTKSAAGRMVVANISESGIRLEGCAELSIGYCYDVLVRLPTGKQVSGMIKVVWSNPEPYIQTYGAELILGTWWERRKLKSFLDNMIQKSSDGFALWKVGIAALSVVTILRSFWSLSSFGWPAALFTMVMLALYLSLAQLTREIRHKR